MNLTKKVLGFGLLFTSLGAVAATGDTVVGGTGTVNFDGTLSASTCEITVDNATKTFVLSTADALLANGTTVKSLTSPVNFKNCNGQNLKLALASTKGIFSGGIAKFEEPCSGEAQPINFFGLVTKANTFNGVSIINTKKCGL